MVAEFIGKCRDEYCCGRPALAARGSLTWVNLGVLIYIGAFGQQSISGILNVICRETRFAIKPEIANHAVTGWVCPGRKRGMADNSFGIRVCVVRIAINHSVFP